MKKVLFALIALLPLVTFAQKLHYKDNGTNMDKKALSTLRYDYTLTSIDSADYIIELLFKKESRLVKPYIAYYKILDRSGKELYKSKEWRAGGYGYVAENYIIKKALSKDLPNALKGLNTIVVREKIISTPNSSLAMN